jgi:hypothetical protein
MNETLVFWLIVASLIISGLVQIVRGLNENRRTYDMTDVIGAMIEIPLLIWGVYYISH